MNSIALWWDTQKNVTEDNFPKIHLDINIWLSKDEKHNSIEFGLKISKFASIKSIYLFLPFICKDSDFSDKIIQLSANAKLTNALFNEKMSISNDNGIFHKVTYPNKDSFYYSNINQKDIIFEEIECERKIRGSQITITPEIKATDKINTVYYRFRIKKVDKILKTLSENNFIIDGLFKKMNFIEFNLNTIRKLPSTIVEKFDGEYSLDSMNLFLITDMFNDFVFKSKDLKASRILENPIWNEYIGHSNRSFVVRPAWPGESLAWRAQFR
ncbi:hypothetical protein [uncultured Desulfobacter sp.]|uniref:hypothetical protein n=1 Tax=uncultured Desulfobacter sp. TaxID=240139 RepID=UPI002AA6BCB5|nr:hypothetical protein [uncultured Desulfobacter sp.]